MTRARCSHGSISDRYVCERAGSRGQKFQRNTKLLLIMKRWIIQSVYRLVYTQQRKWKKEMTGLKATATQKISLCSTGCNTRTNIWRSSLGLSVIHRQPHYLHRIMQQCIISLKIIMFSKCFNWSFGLCIIWTEVFFVFLEYQYYNVILSDVRKCPDATVLNQ